MLSFVVRVFGTPRVALDWTCSCTASGTAARCSESLARTRWGTTCSAAATTSTPRFPTSFRCPAVFLTGTLGAVIKIREAFPDAQVLFDIGVAGPIAGFVVLVPALFFGMTLSNVVPEPTEGSYSIWANRCSSSWRRSRIIGPVRDGYTVNIHPMVFAAWFGMLATALNLLPSDSSMAATSRMPRWDAGRRRFPSPRSAGAIAMTFVSISWLVMTVMMLVDALDSRAPPSARDRTNTSRSDLERYVIAVFALDHVDPLLHPVPIQLARFGRRTVMLSLIAFQVTRLLNRSSRG